MRTRTEIAAEIHARLRRVGENQAPKAYVEECLNHMVEVISEVLEEAQKELRPPSS